MRTVNLDEDRRVFSLTRGARVVFSADLRTHSPHPLNAAVERTNAANAPGGDPTMAETALVLGDARDVLGSNTLTNAISGRRSAPYTLRGGAA